MREAMQRWLVSVSTPNRQACRARPRRNPLAVLSRGLVVSIALAAALTAATFWLSFRSQGETKAVSHTLAVRDQAMQALVLAQRIETSQRGYLLTGREIYLAPFAGGASGLPHALDRLAETVAGDPQQRAQVERLRQVARDKQRELDETIEARKAGNGDAALAMVNNDAGMRLMDEFEQIVEEIVGEENRALAVRQASSNSFARLLQLGAAAAFLALCGTGALLSFLARRSFAEIRDFERSPCCLKPGSAGTNSTA